MGIDNVGRNAFWGIVIPVLALLVFFYFVNWYAKPLPLEISMDGIKFISGQKDYAELVKIEIKGELKRQYFTKVKIFRGEFTVGETKFLSQNLKINYLNGFPLTGKDPALTARVNSKDDGRKILIHWYEDDQPVVLIAAPCHNRAQAVHLSNEFPITYSWKVE